MLTRRSTANVGRSLIIPIAILLLFLALKAQATSASTVIGDETVPLRGQLVYDRSFSGSLNTTVVKAKYVHFQPSYGSLLTIPKHKELPAQILVDAHGKFEFERERQPMMVYCETADGRFAGVQQVDADTPHVEIEMKPTTILRGRLVDHETGEPIAGERLSVGIHFHSSRFRIFEGDLFGKGVTTDESGRFEIPGILVGQQYDLTGFRREKRDDGRKVVYAYGLGRVAANSRPVSEVDDVSRLNAQFSHDALPSERLSEAIRYAASSKHHVLVVLSSPDDVAYRHFNNLRLNDEALREVLGGFEVVVIDRADEHAADVVELTKRLGVKWRPDHQGTSFHFLDESGHLRDEVLATVTEDKLFPQKELYDAAVRNSPVFPDARVLFLAALKRAREENKQILIQETGPYCGPCRLMSRFMASTQEYWSHDFVWLTLDRRWPGTVELMERFRGAKSSSIPWYALLDSEGQVQFTSFDETGNNMGFPGGEPSRRHFRQMLESHSSKMSEKDINSMLSELDK